MLDDQGSNDARPPRKRAHRVRVYATPEEKELIAENARACGLSTSTYARSLALGHRPASNLDLKEVRNLLSVKADLGRLGGLLKMWLTDEFRYNHLYDVTIEDLLEQIGKTQDTLARIVRQIADGSQ